MTAKRLLQKKNHVKSNPSSRCVADALGAAAPRVGYCSCGVVLELNPGQECVRGQQTQRCSVGSSLGQPGTDGGVL